MWFYPPCLLTEFNICLVIIILVFSPVFLFFCVFLRVKNSLFLDNYLYLCRHY